MMSGIDALFKPAFSPSHQIFPSLNNYYVFLYMSININLIFPQKNYLLTYYLLT